MVQAIQMAARWLYEAFCARCGVNTEHERGCCTICSPITRRPTFKLMLVASVADELE